MTKQTKNANRNAVSSREDQQRLDASHESDARGEHRYADVHQTGAEQEARQQRDDLKRRLAGRDTRPKGR